MSQDNTHPIFNLIKPYLEQPSTDYAIMINGKWGSGKTYYLKKHLEHDSSEIIHDDKSVKVRYASANGARTIEDIMTWLKWAKLPGNKSTMANIGKWGEVVIKNFPFQTVANILAPGSGAVVESLKKVTKDSANAVKETINIQDWISFSQHEVIVIDDLERVHQECDLIGLFGEINTAFVEHNHIKTILVCDESQLINRFHSEQQAHQNNTSKNAQDQSNKDAQTKSDGIEPLPTPYKRALIGTNTDYFNAKEKLVRRTFLFDDIEPTLDSIMEFSKYECLPSSYMTIAKNVFKITQSKNLRVFKFILDNLTAVYKQIIDKDLAIRMDRYIVPVVVTDTIDFSKGLIKPKEQIDSVDIDMSGFLTGVDARSILDQMQFANSVGHKSPERRHSRIYNKPQYRYRNIKALRDFLRTGNLSTTINTEIEIWAQELRLKSIETMRLTRLQNPLGYTTDEELSADMTAAITSLKEGIYSLEQFDMFVRAGKMYLDAGISFGDMKSDKDFEEFLISELHNIKLDNREYRYIRDNSYSYADLTPEVHELLRNHNQELASSDIESIMAQLSNGTLNPQTTSLAKLLINGSEGQIQYVADIYVNNPISRKLVIQAVTQLYPTTQDEANRSIADNLVTLYRNVNRDLTSDDRLLSYSNHLLKKDISSWLKRVGLTDMIEQLERFT